MTEPTDKDANEHAAGAAARTPGEAARPGDPAAAAAPVQSAPAPAAPSPGIEVGVHIGEDGLGFGYVGLFTSDIEKATCDNGNATFSAHADGITRVDVTGAPPDTDTVVTVKRKDQ